VRRGGADVKRVAAPEIRTAARGSLSPRGCESFWRGRWANEDRCFLHKPEARAKVFGLKTFFLHKPEARAKVFGLKTFFLHKPEARAKVFGLKTFARASGL
jgi:hypothetical protein